MSPPVELAFDADIEALQTVQAAVERFAEAEALPAKTAYALSLCLEELLTNIVMHGRQESGGATRVGVRVAVAGPEVEVRIDDDGRAYDPTTTPEPDLDALLDDRPIGGLGVHLVRQLASRFEYRHEEGRNRVTIALPRRADGEDDQPADD